MRMLRYLIILFIPIYCFSQEVVSNFYPFLTVDSPPLFESCISVVEDEQKNCFESQLNKHIQENLSFPEEAFDKQEGGKVLTSFSIDENGIVTNILLRGPSEVLENEVKRVLTLLPKFEPAKLNGEFVGINYALPISFYLLSQFNINEVTVKNGANIYESPNSKSKQISFTTSISTFNATRDGDFWLAELTADGNLVGYIDNDDVLTVNNVNNISTNLENIESLNDTNSLVDENDPIIKEPIEIDQKTSLIEKNTELTEDEKIRNNLANDLNFLNSYIQKLEFQKEVNRKLPGYNESDIYYTNALSEFVKILEKEIEIKYTIKSLDNPSAFENTSFEVRNLNFLRKKAIKFRDQGYRVSAKYLKKNFYSYPEESIPERILELTKEFDELEYVEIDYYQIEQPKFNSISIVYQEENKSDTSEIEDQADDSIEDQLISTINSSEKIPLSNNNISNKNTSQPLNNIERSYTESEKENNVASNNSLDASQARERLKELFLIFSQDLITREVYEEIAFELKSIIETDEANKRNSISIPNISIQEAMNRIRNLKSFLDQGLINKETYDQAVKILREVIIDPNN